MSTWATDELRHLDLGDPRRERRVVTLVTDLAEHPEGSIPQACGDWAATKAAYRCWDNPAIDPAAIRGAHITRTRERAQEAARVLAIQDTTSLDFTSHPATAGLGPLEHPARDGLLVHSTLAVRPDGVPL